MSSDSKNSFGILEKMLELLKKYGPLKVIVALMFILMFSCIMYVSLNLKDVVQTVFIEQTEISSEKTSMAHELGSEQRRKIKSDVDNVMKSCMYDVDADRAFIIEMHNGNNNPSGLPFLYGEMTYEQVRNGASCVGDDYSSMTLSRFQLPYYISEHGYWMGSFEELDTIDNKLSLRLQSNGTKAIAVIALNGIDGEIGLFGVSYCHENISVSDDIIRKKVQEASQKLAVLLDRKQYE